MSSEKASGGNTGFVGLLEAVAARARAEGVFGSVRIEGQMLRWCEAAASRGAGGVSGVHGQGAADLGLAGHFASVAEASPSRRTS